MPSVVAMVTETSPNVPKALLISNSTYRVVSSTLTLLALMCVLCVSVCVRAYECACMCVYLRGDVM